MLLKIKTEENWDYVTQYTHTYLNFLDENNAIGSRLSNVALLDETTVHDDHYHLFEILLQLNFTELAINFYGHLVYVSFYVIFSNFPHELRIISVEGNSTKIPKLKFGAPQLGPMQFHFILPNLHCAICTVHYNCMSKNKQTILCISIFSSKCELFGPKGGI